MPASIEGWRPVVALLSMTSVALAVGHLMGGPDEGNRTALAVSCATQHVGVALRGGGGARPSDGGLRPGLP
ncbi:MAG: hypothetical protein U0599_10325 [Vicinamibacteria bacterium]